MNNHSSNLPPPARPAGRPGPFAVRCTAIITLFLRVFVSPKHLSSCPASLF